MAKTTIVAADEFGEGWEKQNLMNTELYTKADKSEDGTAEGQLAYWDDTGKVWRHTELTEVYWNDTLKKLVCTPVQLLSKTLLVTPIAGMIEYDGRYYLTNKGLGRRGVATSNSLKVDTTTVTNTTVETEILSHTYGADELQAAGAVAFNLSGSFSNASAADNFVIRIKIGGVTTQTINRVGGLQTNAGWEITYKSTLRTEGVSGTFTDSIVYMGNGILPIAVSDPTLHTINTTIPTVFSATIQWANAKAGNTLSCTQAGALFTH